MNLKKDFNAKGDNATDDTQAVKNFFTALMNSGEKGWVPAGIYLIDPLVITMTSDVKLEMSNTASFEYFTPDLPKSVLTFDGITKFGVHWKGGSINSSKGKYIDSESSSTCLSLKRNVGFHIEDVKFFGGKTWEDKKADAGISYNTCKGGLINHCYFRGFTDIAIYGGGGAKPNDPVDDGELIVIRDCTFDDNWIGVSNKRESEAIHIVDCRFNRGYYGVLTQQVTSIDPGKRNFIVNCEFHKVVVNPIVSRGTFGSIITNNLIQDIGYVNGNYIAGGRVCGISLEGASHNMVSGNIICQKDWPVNTTIPAIRLALGTFNDKTVVSNNNVVSTNLVNNWTGHKVVETKENKDAGGTNKFFNN